MRISFIFVVILIAIIILALRGNRLGLVGILFGAASWVFTLLFVMLLNAPLTAAITDGTGIAEAVHSYFSQGEGHDLPTMIVKSLADGLTDAIMRIIGTIFTIVVALLIVFIVKCILKNILNEDTFIGYASRTVGTLWGIFEGVIIGWILLAFCRIVLNGSSGGELLADINENVVLSLLYYNNPIAVLFFG